MKTPPVIFMILLAGALDAAPRTSGRYAMAAESLGSAACTQSSARYRSTAHVGSIGALRSAPQVAMRAGFAGMIADPTGLTMRAEPAELEENSTLALNAFLELDDTTLLALAPTGVSWNVLDGPVQVNAAGIVSAPAVPTDRTATISAAHASFSTQRQLSIRNVNTDDFGLYASDGLDDGWQVLHFGENSPLASPTADPDGDQQNNRFEYQAGTLPALATSAFRSRIEGVPGSPAARRIVFSPHLDGRTYTLERTTTLGPTVSWQPVGGAIEADAGLERSLTDPSSPTPSAFYRVVIDGP